MNKPKHSDGVTGGVYRKYETKTEYILKCRSTKQVIILYYICVKVYMCKY